MKFFGRTYNVIDKEKERSGSLLSIGWCTECGRPRYVYSDTIWSLRKNMSKERVSGFGGMLAAGVASNGLVTVGLCKKHRAEMEARHEG